MQVIIGIDPHKATHTAVAVNGSEDELSRLKVRATRAQVDKLLTWAAPFASRTWAIEGAEGLGFLLAQQLVTAGENRRRCPCDVGGAHACARYGQVEEERPERRDVGGGDRAADA